MMPQDYLNGNLNAAVQNSPRTIAGKNQAAKIFSRTLKW
jgi:hypothetical protein